MLSLSQTTGYAIKALGCLSEPGCHNRSTPEITKCAGVPQPYLAKIIHLLARHWLVTARRGIGGGITLNRPPGEITLLQIVEAVEGPGWLGECLLGLDECTDLATCPTHAFWQRIRGEITEELRKTTLATVIGFRDSQRAKVRKGASKRRARGKCDCP